MTVAYLDTIAGIAGDMTLGAFVSAGVSIDTLSDGLQRLEIEGFELAATHVQRNSIDAVRVDVRVTQESLTHRNLGGILSLLHRSSLSPTVKDRVEAVFRVLAEAESRVHNTTVDKIHFHEVGALDSIVDIVGTAICLETLGIDRVYSSPVRLGSGGLIQTKHGTMPTPAPATLEILRGYPVILTSVPQELTTPTGAAIIRALSSGVLDDETISVTMVGYGAGSREIPEIPNLLRLAVGELTHPFEQDDVVLVETNIDDMNPQVYPVLIEKLLAAGAHDAHLIPIIMKKGRPAILLSAMVGKAALQGVLDLIYRETSTIGVRLQSIGRRKLHRRHMEAMTSFGKVNAKLVVRDGKEFVTPEFEDCKRIALERGLPLLEVMRKLERELGPA